MSAEHPFPDVWWDGHRNSFVVADLDRPDGAVVIEHWSAADEAPKASGTGVRLPEVRIQPRPSAIDIDDFIHSALDARHMRWTNADVLDLAHGMAHWLATRGTEFTLDGEPFVPGQLSLSSWRRMIRNRDFDVDGAS